CLLVDRLTAAARDDCEHQCTADEGHADHRPSTHAPLILLRGSPAERLCSIAVGSEAANSVVDAVGEIRLGEEPAIALEPAKRVAGQVQAEISLIGDGIGYL